MTVSEKIARLLELEAAATPGPWEWKPFYQLPNCHGDIENRWAVHQVNNNASVVSLGLVSEADESMPQDTEMRLLMTMRNASRPLLLALQALLVEREARDEYDDSSWSNESERMAHLVRCERFSHARQATDAALKELEDAAQ